MCDTTFASIQLLIPTYVHTLAIAMYNYSCILVQFFLHTHGIEHIAPIP